ncbi:uncharacterized protein LOC101849836 [Aplysia californica]|uniref:Uncharacterized protein LOC101849836 n=1 Tax=Aplysia californica TaxID=6500 RepID=A0ABM0ZXU3_APLCA|nr:uncharacterized protein LOC101849836 [Aplysia californica]
MASRSRTTMMSVASALSLFLQEESDDSQQSQSLGSSGSEFEPPPDLKSEPGTLREDQPNSVTAEGSSCRGLMNPLVTGPAQGGEDNDPSTSQLLSLSRSHPVLQTETKVLLMVQSALSRKTRSHQLRLTETKVLLTV